MSHTTKLLVICLIATLGVAAATGWMWVLLHERASNLEATLQTIANEEVVEQQYRALSSILERSVDERAKIDDFFVDGERAAIDLLATIEAEAERQGITVTDTGLGTAPGVYTDDTVLVIDLQISGIYQSIEQFARLLETLPYASYLAQARIVRDPATVPLTANGQFTVHIATKNIE